MPNQIVEIINEVLNRNGISETIDLTNITITDKTVSDLVKEDQKLSTLIVDAIWPSISCLSVYHYTSKAAAESIINSGEFRLYSILKRFDEGEIRSFCENHALDGYLATDESGEPKYKSLLMDNMFYASFTGTDIDQPLEEYFWGCFASNDGVRLKLKVVASNPNFRKMIYEETKGKPLPLLRNLAEEIKNRYSREFILTGISRLCAFYLYQEFDIENEYRALYRYWEGFGNPPETDGSYRYVPLPLGKMSEAGYQIDIEEIQTNETLNVPAKYTIQPRPA
jgi:hypothetical protein